MLAGGTLTDRFAPRTLMICSNLARMILTGLLDVLEEPVEQPDTCLVLAQTGS